jgi:hypothetical protein
MPSVDGNIPPKQTFDSNDPYCWVDFEGDLRRNSPFESREAMEHFILQRINRVYARIPPGKHIIKKNLLDDLFFFIDKNSFTSLKIAYQVMYREGNKIVSRKQTMRLVDVLQSLDLPAYNRIEFEPNPDALDTKCFNIWRGFQAKDLIAAGEMSLDEIVQEPSFVRIRRFFFENICNGHEASYRHLMRILQLMITRPWEKLEGITVMMAEQGTGKNLFYEFMCDYVLGKGLCHQGTGIKVFTGQFNFHLMGKLLVFADEMASNKDDFHAHWQAMKNASSSKYLAVNKKFADVVTVRNLFYCFFATNNRNAVSLDVSDRRFDIIAMNNAFANNTIFFSSLIQECWNQRTGNLFFSWLRHTHEFDDIDYRKRVDTGVRRELIHLSMPSPLRFLVYMKNERAKPDTPMKRYYDASVFYNSFKAWATRNGEKVISQTAFGNSISGYITKKRDSKTRRIAYDLDSIKLPDLDDKDLQELPPDADVYAESDLAFSAVIP